MQLTSIFHSPSYVGIDDGFIIIKQLTEEMIKACRIVIFIQMIGTPRYWKEFRTVGSRFRRGLFLRVPHHGQEEAFNPSSPSLILITMTGNMILEINPSSLSFILITMTDNMILEINLISPSFILITMTGNRTLEMIRRLRSSSDCCKSN